MKGIKLVLGLSIATIGVGAISFGVVSTNNLSINLANAEGPTNQRRIWIINNDNWWTDNKYCAEVSNGVSTVFTAKVEIVLSDYYKGLGFVDVDITNATSALSVKIFYDVDNHSYADYNQTVSLSLPALGGEDVIWMNSGHTAEGGYECRNASLGTTNGFSGDQLGVILSKYDTCSNAVTNGYNAFPQLKTNFFDKTDSGAFDAKVYGQDVYTCRDYADGMSERYEANK